MSLVLAFLSTSTLLLSSLRFGWNSLVSFGILGTYIYSLPGIINIKLPFYRVAGRSTLFETISNDTLFGLCLAWATLLVCTSVIPAPRRRLDPIEAGYESRLQDYLTVCTLLAVSGLLAILIQLGPLFFLQTRSEIDGGLIMLLWRWVLIYGAIISVYLRRRLSFMIFLTGLIIYFIAGDRTMPAIFVTALLLARSMLGAKRRPLPPIRYVLLGSAAFIFLILGKPIYLAIKYQSLDAIGIFLTHDAFIRALMSFEPLITINLLDYSVINSLTMPIDDFVVSVFGNLLIVPRAFSVDTNYFNTFFTASLPVNPGYGVAGNFYAHGYVVFGYFGFVAFAALFFLALLVLERKVINSAGFVRYVLLIIGSTVAIYTQRNGLDNIFSFVRQILIVAVIIWGTVTLLKVIAPSGRPSRRATI